MSRRKTPKREQVNVRFTRGTLAPVQEKAKEAGLGVSAYVRASVERSLVTTTLGERARRLVREVRAMLRVPKGTDPALAAALRAHRIVMEDKIRAWKGHPPTIEWGMEDMRKS